MGFRLPTSLTVSLPIATLFGFILVCLQYGDILADASALTTPSSELLIGLISLPKGLISRTSYTSNHINVTYHEDFMREQMRRRYNRTTLRLGNTDVSIRYVWAEVNQDLPYPASVLRKATRELIQKNVNVIIAPTSSYMEPVAIEAELAGVPAVGYGATATSQFRCNSQLLTPCTTTDVRRFKYVHSPFSATSEYYSQCINALVVQRPKTMAVIYYNSDFFNELGLSAIQTAENNNIQIVYVHFLRNTTSAAAAINPVILKDIVRNLVYVDADIVVLAVGSCSTWLNAFSDAGYAPKAVLVNACVDFPDQMSKLKDPRIKQFLIGPSQWDPHLKGNDYIETADQTFSLFPMNQDTLASISISTNGNRDVFIDTSTSKTEKKNKVVWPPQLFFNAWSEQFGFEPSYINAGMIAAYYMIFSAVIKANSTDRDAINQALTQTYQTSFLGRLSPNQFGLNQGKGMVVLQRDEKMNLHIVSPSFAATGALIYPAPAFPDRSYTEVTDLTVTTSTDTVLFTVISILTILYIGMIAFILYYRERTPIKSTAYPVSCLILFGSILGNLSILTWMHQNTESMCRWRIWVFSLGFYMYMGIVTCRSFRIGYIFGSFGSKIKSVDFTDRKVLFLSLGVFLPQVIVNIIWTIYDPMLSEIIQVDPLRPSSNFQRCTSKHAAEFWTVSIILAGVVLVCSVVFGFLIRKAYDVFNDSRSIGFAAYTFSIAFLAVCMIQYFETQKNALDVFYVRSFVYIFTFFISTCILFGPRFYDVIAGQDESDRATKQQSGFRTGSQLSKRNSSGI